MEFFSNGVLNMEAFDRELRLGTRQFTEVLASVAKTQAAAIESTHFLVALGSNPNGNALAFLGKMISAEQWESGLSACVETGMGLPPESLKRENFHPSALAMLATAEQNCMKHGLERVSETNLLLSALSNLTTPVSELINDSGIELQKWVEQLEREVSPPLDLHVFTDAGEIDLSLFDPSGIKILKLMLQEASAMGFSKADPRHLLLALLVMEGGSMQYGLFLQGMQPRKIQETVTLNLQAGAKRTPTQLKLDRDHLQTVLQLILEAAAKICSVDRDEAISETHLVRAFVQEHSIARRILEDEQVNLLRLRETAVGYEIPEEDLEADTLADIETVRSRLYARLVGQDDAIERILPYVQRMRFGFTLPGKPVGVFLFCGQSGSGKTEMAKELARSVYGSEESLIFLEMGQFNAPESMNIFVGAPPGYIGYGEGKLTNGLRDKPRSVVLFDEVEKAHVRVLDALLRFLDEGVIDDPAGPVRDGSQCIIILTSNVGAEELSRLSVELEGNPDWRKEVRARLRDEFKKHNFRVEFLNRVDEPILFKTLDGDDYTEIARRQLKRILRRLEEEKNVFVDVDDLVVTGIGSHCGRINEGARAVMRLIQSLIVTPVIAFILENNLEPPVKVKVSAMLGGDESEPVTKVGTL